MTDTGLDGAAASLPQDAVPPLPRLAIFSDFDGTLVDIAPTPDTISVPSDMAAMLETVSRDLDGAFAIISGRPIHDLDRHLDNVPLAAAGSHGAERRLADGSSIGIPDEVSAEAREIAARLEQFVARHQGLLLEVKPAAVALHYRQAPQLQGESLAAMRTVLEAITGFSIVEGKMVVEARPRDVSKGLAIAAFMQEAPFRGRTPVFFGDDVTDEDGFRAVQELGGVGIKVGPGETVARLRIEDVPSARNVIRKLGEDAARKAA
ncbi:trehalose 6-phosphate phosphatase [Devosia enhydra]|uniref:Trehalose 6-phosphate phosphatase n=1 Tax=Devosia enhydra TaxID=665118 RepID=A0A1K2HWS9_9HYPH|nr:trehalose-phosphatase [Devosia enhydra]SFZ83196.1 trehalose 6-phosphate phosphatase [Devosia enhydra]